MLLVQLNQCSVVANEFREGEGQMIFFLLVVEVNVAGSAGKLVRGW